MVQVGGVHHRNREVEDERRGRRGRRRDGSCRRLGSEQRAHCGGGLSGAGSSKDLRLELQQLAHEAEVRGDDAAAAAHKLEGLIQTHPFPLHQVGQADCGRARDACLTVDQDAPVGIPNRV